MGLIFVQIQYRSGSQSPLQTLQVKQDMVKL